MRGVGRIIFYFLIGASILGVPLVKPQRNIAECQSFDRQRSPNLSKKCDREGLPTSFVGPGPPFKIKCLMYLLIINLCTC